LKQRQDHRGVLETTQEEGQYQVGDKRLEKKSYKEEKGGMKKRRNSRKTCREKLGCNTTICYSV